MYDMAVVTLRRTSLAFLLHAIALGARASDCNQNGADDAADLAQGTSHDVNGNAVPDECDIERDVFGYAVHFQLDLGPTTKFADLADMDLDGIPDVVAIEPDAARVFLLKDRGELRSVLTTKSSAGAFRGVSHAVVEDLDEDGDPDLAAAAWGELILLRNVEKGRLELEARLENGSDPAFVTAADLNGDGRMDLLTANSLLGDLPDNFSIYLSQGGLQLAEPLHFVAGKVHGAAVARDFDGDGDIDWALALRDVRTVRVHLNRGSGIQFEAVDSPALPAEACFRPRPEQWGGELRHPDWAIRRRLAARWG